MVSLTVTRRPFCNCERTTGQLRRAFKTPPEPEMGTSITGCEGGSEAFRTQSPVALAISSPTFLGERPRGPILGARAEEAPTSPPVARRWLYSHHVSIVWLIDHNLRSRGQIAVVMVSARGRRLAYMTFTSLGSNLGAVRRTTVSTLIATGSNDGMKLYTHAY